jgi:hypothetical protein
MTVVEESADERAAYTVRPSGCAEGCAATCCARKNLLRELDLFFVLKVCQTGRIAMTRSACSVLVPVFLVLGLAGLPAPAQPPRAAEQNSLDSGPRARAQFEADQMSAVELARERVEAARAEYLVLERLRDAGKTVTFRLLDSSARLLEAELALLEKNADRAAPFEDYWKRSLETEKIFKVRFDAGNLAPEDYFATRYTRLDAQLAWEQAKAEKPAGSASLVSQVVRAVFIPYGPAGEMLGWASPMSQVRLGWHGLDPDEERAKILFEASMPSPQELARARLEAAQKEVVSLQRQRDAGKEVIERLSECSLAVLKAELALLEKSADRVAPFERHWKRNLETDLIFTSRFEARRLAEEDYYQTRYARLDAQLAWEQAKAQYAKTASATSYSPLANPLDAQESPVDSRKWHRALFEGSTASPKELARARLVAAAKEWLILARYRDAGRYVISRLMGSSPRLLEAELGMLEKNADRVAPFERHRKRMLETEMLFETYPAAKSGSPEDYYAARHASLDAQLALLRAKASRDKK